MSKEVFIIKSDGEIQNRDYVFERIESSLKTMANGKHILTIKKDVKKRSVDQNALFWLWATCMERETGTGRNDIHDYYCNLFLSCMVEINGVERNVTRGTSRLNSAQFTEFLNKIQADAASEFGIRLPLPDDLYFESFKDEYERYMY